MKSPEQYQPSTEEIKKAEEMMTEQEAKKSERREVRTEVPNDTLEIEHDGNVFETKLDFVWPDVPEKYEYFYTNTDINLIEDEFSAPFGEDVAEELIAHQERIPISWQDYKLCFLGSHRYLTEEEVEAADFSHAYHGGASKRNFVDYAVLYYSANKWKLKYESFSKIANFDRSRVISILDREDYENRNFIEVESKKRDEREEKRVKKYLETLTDNEREILNRMIESETYTYYEGQRLPEIWNESVIAEITKEEEMLRGLSKKISMEMTEHYVSFDIDNDKLTKILDEKLSKIPQKNREDVKKRIDLYEFTVGFSNIELRKKGKAEWKEQKMREFPWRYKKEKDEIKEN